MKDLEEYVDKLFSKYGKTKKIEELKEEILTNLEDKVTDYVESGMTYEDALLKAEGDIKSVDAIIGCTKKVYINHVIYEIVQSTLIYLMIAWIITIPTRISLNGMVINSFIMTAALICFVLYVLLSNKKDAEYLNKVSVVNTKKLMKSNKLMWLIWAIYILSEIAFTTAVRFGSNIWFHRRIKIDGPYQFAEIALGYVLPLISIVIPIIFNKACSIVSKYEVRDDG